MADSLDPATSILLCCEDTSTFFDDDLECNDVVGSGILPFWPHTNVNSFNQGPSFVLQSEETVRVMIEREREHLPRDDYINRLRSGELDMSIRREAIDWICKGHAYYGYGYLTFCLAVNYLDRFLSVYELPRGKSWTGQLLAVACLSIAGKMDEIKVPQSVDLQVGEPDFFFDGKTIQRMELLVLGTLRWKMNALTPCSFIDYFLSRITYEKQPSKLFISTSIQLVVSLIRGIDFLEFKPSEIAAAVAIYVTREVQAKDIDKVHVGFSIVKEERVLKCVELIRDLSFNVSANLGSNNNYAPCVPGSPVRVLDTRCLSFKSDDELTVGSCPNTSLNIPNTKIPKSDQPS